MEKGRYTDMRPIGYKFMDEMLMPGNRYAITHGLITNFLSRNIIISVSADILFVKERDNNGYIVKIDW